MPQMMPLNWLLLMIMFIIIFMLFSNLNYFLINYKNKFMKIKKMSLSKNWKW